MKKTKLLRFLTVAVAIGSVLLLVINFRPIKYTYYDKKGNKSVETFFSNIHDQTANKVIRYFPNGVKKEVAGLDGNSYEGSRTYFYQNGRIEYKSYYKNNKLHGYSYLYDKEGYLSEKIFRFENRSYGNLFFFYNNGALKHYNSVDFIDKTLYVLDYDSLGNVKLHEGVVFSPVIIRYNSKTKSYGIWNDSATVNEQLILLITVAEPPNTITKVKVLENKNSVTVETKLPIVDCSALYDRMFTKPGIYKLKILGEIRDKKTNRMIRADTLPKNIVVN